MTAADLQTLNELVSRWRREAASHLHRAETARGNGMLEVARGHRLRAEEQQIAAGQLATELLNLQPPA